MFDVWLVSLPREGVIEDSVYGLIAEARRQIDELAIQGTVTAVVMGPATDTDLAELGAYGVNRVLHLTDERMAHYHGERFAGELRLMVKEYNPACIFMAQTAETDDLGPRLAALSVTDFIRRAMDLKMGADGNASAIRPVANGYLFEEVCFEWQKGAPVISWLPSVLLDPQPDSEAKARIIKVSPSLAPENLKTKITDVTAAAPEDLDLEEADIIVAGGRGVGKGEAFDIIHDLARAIGGTVGGTRPIIDWGTLPYQRQIGQTGKYVSPRLIINCGISGANEYTAGMEKAQQVIAIDLNPRARIFRFADLGVQGDVSELLPLLIERIEELKTA
ncbi:electron transfer flavoprotein subunit alpha/FixB family protein [Desulfococcaceae bacterium HSG7]|nr:electron transfer flavoprotein subunit alpha/FixB family protein [Desulfococcaceae bacterium HSG7]